MKNDMFAIIRNLSPQLIALRREFHRYPETGWTEVRTSSRIAAILTGLGYEVLTGRQVCKEESRMGLPGRKILEREYDRALAQGADPAFAPAMREGFTGVVGILKRGEGPTVALRFDMDALPLGEADSPDHLPAGEGFRSCREGVMHGCGHDGHIAMGLGVAKVLSEVPGLCGTVKLLFQPAEEGVRGARSMVEQGHLDGVDYVLAAHMGGGAKGISIGRGKSLATTKLDALFHGAAAHAGFAPQDGSNALLAAATAVLNLHAMPRHGEGATRINVGTIHGGTGRNIVCPQVKLELEVRGETSRANDDLTAYAIRILEAAAGMHGCTVEILPMGAAESAENTPALMEKMAEVCRSRGIPVELPETDGPLGSEDFSYMAKRVQEQGGQSCYFYVRSHCPAGLHQSTFDFEEDSLALGVQAFAEITAELLQ